MATPLVMRIGRLPGLSASDWSAVIVVGIVLVLGGATAGLMWVDARAAVVLGALCYAYQLLVFVVHLLMVVSAARRKRAAPLFDQVDPEAILVMTGAAVVGHAALAAPLAALAPAAFAGAGVGPGGLIARAAYSALDIASTIGAGPLVPVDGGATWLFLATTVELYLLQLVLYGVALFRLPPPPGWLRRLRGWGPLASRGPAGAADAVIAAAAGALLLGLGWAEGPAPWIVLGGAIAVWLWIHAIALVYAAEALLVKRGHDLGPLAVVYVATYLSNAGLVAAVTRVGSDWDGIAPADPWERHVLRGLGWSMDAFVGYGGFSARPVGVGALAVGAVPVVVGICVRDVILKNFIGRFILEGEK